MRKIVINKCFGGFGLSDKAYARYLELKGIEYETSEPDWKISNESLYWHKGHVNEDDYYIYCRDFPRDDPALIQTVEELGDKANGWCADLGIVEIPDDVEWEIAEYDGNEHVAEKHRTWY